MKILYFWCLLNILLIQLVAGQSNVDSLLQAARSVASGISGSIPDWHSYTYDYGGTPVNQILDGGYDMYDSGNMVNFKVGNANEVLATYNQTYSYSSSIPDQAQLTTLAIHPFFALMFVENLVNESLYLNVSGNYGADFKGMRAQNNGRVEYNGLIGTYFTNNIYEQQDVDPSICEVYFQVEGTDKWRTFSGGFAILAFTNSTEISNSSVRLKGPSQNVLIGYMLLSRINGQLVTDSMVTQAMSTLLSGFSGATIMPYTAASTAAAPTTAVPTTTAVTTATRTTADSTNILPTVLVSTAINLTTHLTIVPTSNSTIDQITSEVLNIVPKCPPLNLYNSSRDWPRLHFGSAVFYSRETSLQTCNNTGRPVATLKCELDSNNIARYNSATLTVLPCDNNLTSLMKDIEMLDNMNTNSLNKVTSSLEVLTASPMSLSTQNVRTATEILTTINRNTENLTVSVEAIENILQTVNHLTLAVNNQENLENVSSSQDTGNVEVKSTLLTTLNTLVERVELPVNSTTANITSADFVVQILQISLNNRRNMDNYTDNQGIIFQLPTTANESDGYIQLVVPSDTLEVIAQAFNTSTIHVFATLLKNGTLLDRRQNLSQVVTIGTRSPSSSTPFSINFKSVTIPPRETKSPTNPLKTTLQQAVLKNWDSMSLSWKNPVGCYPGSQEGYPTYTCNKFATFSVLFSSRVVPSSIVLQHVSYIGCAFSIFFLLATIAIHLYHREMRKRRKTGPFVNICICLLMTYLLFCVGVGQTSNKAVCDVMTFLLQYFTLCCWSWMCINSYIMYSTFTTFVYEMTKTKIALTYFVSYGITMIIAFLNFAITTLHLDHKQDQHDIYFESLYRARHVCWLGPPSLYYGFFLPVGIALLFNMAIFALLIRTLSCQTIKIRTSAKKKSTKDHLLNTITLATMMGLTWIFGYFLLISDNVTYQTAMQWIFTILNIFQGIIIFILVCVRPVDVRMLWMPSCVVETKREKMSTTSNAQQSNSTQASAL